MWGFTPTRVLRGSFVFDALLVAGAIAWAFTALRTISSQIIVHFDQYVLVDRFGSIWDLAAIGGFGLVLIGMNALCAEALRERDKALAFFVAAATLVMSILLFIGFSSIIRANYTL